MDWPTPRRVSVWLTGSAVIPIRGACITRTIKTPMIQRIRNNKGKVGRPKVSDFMQCIRLFFSLASVQAITLSSTVGLFSKTIRKQ